MNSPTQKYQIRLLFEEEKLNVEISQKANKSDVNYKE